MKQFRAPLLSGLFLVLPLLLHAMGGAPASIAVTGKGFQAVDAESGLVWRLEAAGNGSFRVTTAQSSSDLPADTGTFIDPALSTPAFTITTNGPVYGVKTAAGSVELDTSKFQVTLRDPSGKTLYGPAEISANGGARMRMVASYPSGERAYGIGNGPLVKTKAETVVANTVTRAPVMWTTSGYGILVRAEKAGAVWERGTKDSWDVSGKAMDVFFFTGADAYGLLDSYSGLTGKPPVPPLWAFGYIQSRWGYNTPDDVTAKWSEFRKREIPVDAFIYDYDWYRKDFEWNQALFPDPKAALDLARSMGIRFVGIRKPRVTESNLSYAYKNKWVLAKGSAGNGDDVDFSKPEVRAWWNSNLAHAYPEGVAGWWNDEAEQSMTEYYWMVTSELEGYRAYNPDGRFWTVNRTFSPGLQRLGAAVWTGDIGSSWGVLRETPQTLLDYALCGIPYACSDTGGFNGSPSAELFARWQQQSAFTPVMRAHGSLNANRWPWGYGADAEACIRKAIEARYRLLPYLYSLAHEAYNTGAPLMRPLFMEFPSDPKTPVMTDAWLLGPSVYVAPLTNRGGVRQVYFPAGKWVPIDGGPVFLGPTNLEIAQGLLDLPAYYREGGIVPSIPLRQSTGTAVWSNLVLEVTPGRDCAFVLYEDDGQTLGYTRGEAATTRIEWNEGSRTLAMKPSQGAFAALPSGRLVTVRLHGLSGLPSSVTLNGTALEYGAYPDTNAAFSYDPFTRSVEIVCGSVDSKAGFTLALGAMKPFAATNAGFSAEAALRAAANAARIEGGDAVRPLLSGFIDSGRKNPAEANAGNYAKLLQTCLGKLPAASKDAFLAAVLPFEPRVLTAPASADNSTGNLLVSLRSAFPGSAAVLRVKSAPPYAASDAQYALETTGSLRIPFSTAEKDKLLLVRNRLAFEVDFEGVKRVIDSPNDYFWQGESVPCYASAGPFTSAGTNDGFDTDFIGETARDVLVSAASDGKTVKWKTTETARETVINPGELSSIKFGTAYVAFRVKSADVRKTVLSFGSGGSAKVWVNGAEVLSFQGQRANMPGTDRKEISLDAGWNTVLVKVSKAGRGSSFTLQLQDASGSPMPELVYSASGK